MIHVQMEGKRNSFCMLLESYLGFKLAGIHEHDKMLSTHVLFDMPAWAHKQIIFHTPYKHY